MNALATRWLPTDPPRPCPPVLTADEAVIYLRLDHTGVTKPRRTLEHYRESGRLRGTRLGRCIVYRVEDLDAFIEEQRA